MRALGPDDPRTVGTYRVLRVLGAGGMGRVYVGRAPTGRIVAIKVILPGLADDPGFRGRFRREVDAARRVGGAWTAPVLDADTEAEQPWLVTGYVPGLSLGEAVAERGPLPADSLRALVAGLAEALGAVHEAGLVHRDLKPSNVMLSPDGPRVIDFGISRAVDASVLTGTGLTVGSPGFMSPEQIEGADVGPATDVFALGAVLAYAATGGGPFGDGNSQALMFRILTQEPRLDALPEEFRPIAAACLAKQPADRPSTRDVLRAVLPDGDAAALVAAGWLPPDLANTVSRRAVALLELDDEPSAEPPTRPPLPPPGPPSAPTTVVNGPGPYGSSFAGSDVATTFQPAPDRRRPAWLYITASVVAVAVVIATVLLLRMRGDDDPAKNTGQSPGSATGLDGTAGSQGQPPATPPRSSAPPSVPPATGTGPLPQGYVGTWKGLAYDGLASQEIVVTLRAGSTGDVVGAFTASVMGVRCLGESRLLGIGSGVVRLEDVPGSGNTENPFCKDGGAYTLQLQDDGTLRYTGISDSPAPLTGTLVKAP